MWKYTPVVREFLESLDLKGLHGHSTVWTFQDLIDRILEKSEDYLRSRGPRKYNLEAVVTSSNLLLAMFGH